MGSTDFLEVRGTQNVRDNEVLIHPNDGCDLGIMKTSYPAKIYLNATQEQFESGTGDPVDGHILLKNECHTGTIELSQCQCARLGNPSRARLTCQDGKILVSL